MADFTYQGADTAPVSVRMASLANWAGAGLSLALIIGIAIWGYRVVVRDVSGVPVVEALSGPMRVAPDDPGGTLADHQGLAVNAVAGQGAAADPVDRLVLAPRPAGLQADDVAQGAMVPVTETPEFPASLARNAEIMEPVAASEPIPESPEPGSEDPLMAMAAKIAAQSKPLTPLREGTEDDVLAALAAAMTEDDAPEATPARYTGPGLARSLRPQVRPTGLADAPRASRPAVALETSVKEIDPETLPEGTRLAQIGAFDSAEAARAEWQRLDGQFGDYLDGKDRVIERATSGGHIFYRLRAHGFEDLSDARRFCAAFASQGVDCIPAVAR